ncbi:MmgE/PrpD family protein [Thermodesulfobacteriota bacterium]
MICPQQFKNVQKRNLLILTVSEQLVDLAMGIRFEDLPPEVIREAEMRVLDALGRIIAGSVGSTSQQVREIVSGLGGGQESRILGTRDMTSCEKATLVNCTSLRLFDYMDGHPGPYPCHACFNIPPILAAAERADANGKKFITAIVTAYEIMPRFQENAGLPSLDKRGWAGGTNLEFSVPLAIAPLLGLDREQTISAIGISITHGNALNASSHGQIPESKSILDGMTAMNAVVAVLLAYAGVAGPREVIEGSGDM